MIPPLASSGISLSVSYSRIEPSLRGSGPPPMSPTGPFSILLSDRTIATGGDAHAVWADIDFQYPTLGSNHRYCSTPATRAGVPNTFSILLSDRTIATGHTDAWDRRRHPSFSILLSDRTIATNPSRRALGGQAFTFSILLSDRTIATFL